MLREVNPWRREFCEDFSRVAGVLGPRDLAPLARAVSDFSFDVISGILLRFQFRSGVGWSRWVGRGCC